MRGRGMFIGAVVTLAGLVFVGPASAHTVSWQGVTWDHPYGDITVNGDGDLAVANTSCFDARTDKGTPAPKARGQASDCWGAAHYNTPSSFRSAAVQKIEFSFVDEGVNEPSPQIWIEQEGGTEPAWMQFGAWNWNSHYSLYWWDVDDGDDEFVDLGIARKAGAHDLMVVKLANGQVQFWFDGTLVHETDADDVVSYLGDVYLSAHSSGRGAAAANGKNPHNDPGTVVYTDYGTSTATA